MNDLQIPDGIALDIDDTLSQTTIFWIQKMMEKFGNDEGLTAKEIREKYFYVQHVPYPGWARDKVGETLKFWINDDAFQLELKTVTGSVGALASMMHSGIQCSCYLSNRPISTYDATKRRLNLHCFPERPIVLRPEHVAKEKGNERKSEFLQQHKNITGIIDDNPFLIEAMPSGYPGTIYLFETEKFSNPNKIDVIQCKDWQDVLRKII